MTTKLNFERDINGYNAYAPDFPDIIYTASLLNGDRESITVPDNFAVWVMAISIQAGTVVWVSRNGTAAVPAGSTFAAGASELNPSQRRVYAGDVIDFITTNVTSEVEVAFYAIS